MSFADAILFQDVATVKRYLDQGENVNAVDEYGFTPIIEAAIGNRADMAKLLIAFSANVNEPDLAGRTALHWAADNNNLSFCELLLKHGADPNARDRQNQPPMTSALLRSEEPLRKLLYQYGASINFAKDFINGKLLGHRFELRGHGYIGAPDGKFALLDFEGFYLEFALDVIRNSLFRFKKNFAARSLNSYFPRIKKILTALDAATELIKYQQYTLDRTRHEQRINELVGNNIVIIPTVYQGHAITFVRVADFLAKCDRGANADREGAINIFQMQHPEQLTPTLIKDLIYEIQDDTFIHTTLSERLGLEKLIQLPVGKQITGNCSWANTEATIPSLLFLLLYIDREATCDINQTVIEAIEFFHAWQQWDQDRALNECLQSFADDNLQRNAAKATILASVLFQTCRYTHGKDIERAEKIMQILSRKEYKKYVENYFKVYYEETWTAAGENLTHLFDIIAND
jgi:Ankyrin repeats (3 copies)